MLVAIIIVVVIVLLVTNKKSKKGGGKRIQRGEAAQNRQRAIQRAQTQNYKDLRQKALSTVPADIGITPNPDHQECYGMVIDWALEGGVVTLAVFANGDAKLLTSAGKVLTGSQPELIRAETFNLIHLANNSLSQTSKALGLALPQLGFVNFYFLTNDGMQFAEDSQIMMESGESNWALVFESMKRIMDSIRNRIPASSGMDNNFQNPDDSGFITPPDRPLI